MFHFFPRYAVDVANDSFAVALRQLQVPHRLFSAAVNLRYQTMLGLIGRVYPRLVWYATCTAIRSMFFSQPRPTAAIVGSDIEALVFGILKRVFRLKTLIIFQTVIITPRKQPRWNTVYQYYYQKVLSVTDFGICHSSVEAAQYTAAFSNTGCQFVFIPYGTTVVGREALMTAYAEGARCGSIVSAGRSGRDYPTLAKAVCGLPCQLLIICDTAAATSGIAPSQQITVTRDCFGQAYIDALANAIFVVVPLSVDAVSAGQMVLLQAQALGKPIIVTRTTTSEYATDEQDALLVDRGNVEQMRVAISRLLGDDSLRERLGANAASRFERDHTTEVYVRKLVAAIQSVIPGVSESVPSTGLHKGSP
jgi:glycosyltransferase involved in cell wall biosynthesis